LTNTTLQQLEGEPGSFSARIRQEPRYVDIAKCTSCGDCLQVCPVGLPNEYNLGLNERKAIYKQYDQAIPGAYAIHKAGPAPCRLRCPAGLNVQGYVQMVKQGKYKEALEIIMNQLPLPGVLGRICTAQCEDSCRRAELDDAIAIRSLKRLAADQYDPREIEIECAPERAERIAIVGSGPAGLSAAYHLAKKGIKSTIFEAMDEPGGMLRYGIPAHRLPRDVLDREIEVITALGVEIRTNSPIGSELTVDGLFEQGYRGVYLAIGAHKGMDLGISGEDAEGVRQGVDFLREVNSSGTAWVGKKVGIVGGGNVAIDVARTARRLGAQEVHVIYRRTCEEMPALPEEVEAADCEGIEFSYLAAPIEILTENGRVAGLRCKRMELGEPDASGRRRPVPVEGSEYDIEVDQIIPAIGQRPDISPLQDIQGLGFTRWNTAEIDAVTHATAREGVFAGGDFRSGPWVAIGAVRDGMEAAESIERYLDGRDMAEGRERTAEQPEPECRPVPDDAPLMERLSMPAQPPEERSCDFREVELGYDTDSGTAEAERCLNCGYCCECMQCVQACLPEAVDHTQEPVDRDIPVGSVILSPGSDPYDPARLDEFYQYREHPNVLTSLEFERILSASGPTMGHLQRPSDQKEPKRIAWLQCVGSRDLHQCGNGYCSAVCCMYAIKEAMVAKEHASEDLDCVIFNMDIRSFGKDFEKYYDRAREQDGVRFVKARVHSVVPVRESDGLSVRYVTETGELIEEVYDLVVLSVGLEVPPAVAETGRRLGLELNEYNFARVHPFAPVSTSRPGVYVCGTFQGPKDIPSSVTESSAAACAAGRDIASARHTRTQELELPAESDIASQEPRVGVFICNCGINIGGIVDVNEVQDAVSRLPEVAYATQNLFTCSEDAQQQMKKIIHDNRLNRVVVASCSPRTHEGIFMETLEASGLNKYLFEMANIRNQNSWVHSDNPEEATEKAKELIRMSVARAARLRPLHEKKIPVNPKALVIGGGVGGMNAALGLADQGFETYLIEKNGQLGGMAANLTRTIEGEDIRAYLQELIHRVERNENVQVITQATISEASGFKGNFTTKVLAGPDNEETTIEHGVVVVATGANEYRPKEYLYGQDERVMTQTELSRHLESRGVGNIRRAVMVQCIGSRNEENPNCSRVCCQSAVKNALHIKRQNPEAQVFVLYRDIRTYGLLEDYYTLARKEGVQFVHFTPDNPPQTRTEGERLLVTFRDPLIGRDLEVDTDLLALSAGVRAEETKDLSSLLKLARTEEGHFMEAHVKLRPVDMPKDGVFVCGTAHSPMLVSETIAQAYAAASRAMTILSQPYLTLSAVVARVDTEKCASCLICVRACPYGVPRINEEGVSEIDPALCQGCGVCAGECPAKAIELDWYEDEQILKEIDALLEGSL
jgi:heterodisulfide reductase subunit A-like polyferredoxin